MADKLVKDNERRTLGEIRKVSAIVDDGPKKYATKADLAFVDAAIQMHQASRAAAAEGAIVETSNPAACDVIDLTAALVAVAVYAYHVYNSCLIGGDSAAFELARRLNVAPTVSLDNLIKARNQLASALGEAAY